MFPGDKALGAMAAVFTRPEEGTAATIDSLDDCFGDRKGGHEVERERAQNGRGQSEAPSSVKKGGAPPREVLVAGGEEREAIVNRDFVGRKREAKVGLRKGGDNGTKGSGKIVGRDRVHGNREKGGLVVIDREPSCRFKEVEDPLGGIDRVWVTLDEDQGVIGVLKD